MSREEAYFANSNLGRIGQLPKGKAWEIVEADDLAYADGRIAAEGIHRLEAAKLRPEKPFFLALGFVKPHLPFTPPKKYWDLYRREDFKTHPVTQLPKGAPGVAGKRGGEIMNYDLETEAKAHEFPVATQQALLHGYYASVSYMDAQLGKVLDALDRLKLSENTIIVLWGDHGWHLGDLGIWTKHTNYEQANRIPIILVAPQKIQAGQKTQHLMETVDLYPTLVGLAGLPAPKNDVPQCLDGTDLTPLVTQKQKALKDHVYHAFPRGEVLGRAIRTDRYRLVEWKKSGAPSSSAQYELYDYADSQVELENVYDAEPEIAQKLKALLAKHPEAKTKREAQQGEHPKVAKQAFRILAEVRGQPGDQGVIVSHGGSTQGYVLRADKDQLVFELRRSGQLHTWRAPWHRTPNLSQKLEVELNATQVTLYVEGKVLMQSASPGLLPQQPREEFLIGSDAGSLVGEYSESNGFSGEVISAEVLLIP